MLYVALMFHLGGVVILELMLVFSSVQAQAWPGNLVNKAVDSSIQMFKKEFAGNGESKDSIVGLSVINETDFLHIDIYLAETPEDVTAFRYRCNSSVSACKFESSMTRCFYYAQVGTYSLDDLQEALKRSLDLSKTEFNSELKFWQSRGWLWGQIDTNSYLCQSSSPGKLPLSCQGTSAPGENPP
jgi:hypothetical protein